MEKITMISKPRPKTMAQTIEFLTSRYQNSHKGVADVLALKGFCNSFLTTGLNYRPANVTKRQAFEAIANHLLKSAAPEFKPLVKNEIKEFSKCITTPIEDLAALAGMSKKEFLTGKSTGK